MDEKQLMKWGGICAFVVAVLWIVGEILYLVARGVPSETLTLSGLAEELTGSVYRTQHVFFSASLLFFVVVAYTVYEYLKKTSYGLSRIGFGFVTLYIIFSFVLFIILSAGKNIALANVFDVEAQLGVIVHLYGSLVIPFAWFILLFSLFWGLAFLNLEGMNKVVGILLLVSSGAALLFYIFSLTETIIMISIIVLILRILFIVANAFIGLVLFEESKRAKGVAKKTGAAAKKE